MYRLLYIVVCALLLYYILIYQIASLILIDISKVILYYINMQNNDDTKEEKVYKPYKLLQNFKHYLSAENGLSHNTVKNYLSDIRHYLGWLQSTRDINDEIAAYIKPHIITEYSSYLEATITSPITIKRRLSSLNKFIEFISGRKIKIHTPVPHSDRQLGNANTDDAPFLSSTEYYAKSLLREYSSERNASQKNLNDIKNFLLYVHK